MLRTPQNNKEEGARAKKLVTCETRGPLGRGQIVPFSVQGACCSAPEPIEALTGQESFLVRGVAVNRKAPLKNTNNNMQAGHLWPSGPSLS